MQKIDEWLESRGLLPLTKLKPSDINKNVFSLFYNVFFLFVFVYTLYDKRSSIHQHNNKGDYLNFTSMKIYVGLSIKFSFQSFCVVFVYTAALSRFGENHKELHKHAVLPEP